MWRGEKEREEKLVWVKSGKKEKHLSIVHHKKEPTKAQ